MALMSINNLSVDHRLQSIDLELKQGEVLGLIGPNGAGKSSLLSALSGLVNHTGLVEFNGINLASLTALERARSIALQPQFVESAWALSVHDVVSLGRLPWGDCDQKIIKSAMQQANVTELANRHVDELSGGEKARVWLARVLANQADVLLVDEPVANLDIHYQRDVMNLLSDYARSGHGVIIAIHDLSLAARYCDRLCLLDNSKMVKSGRVEEVLTDKILSTVFNTDVFINLESNPPVVLAR
ncbi:MAG: ABC transporter ATP-binding protein [Gammaproteobacteria bacterium]|jgi:iron complex transport system ATP-binding protein|nr:ABC transporter ATP-binding protein [Gammaproteobacteria bacterium]MBT3722335.1 ABC transporter ATP-binding protein [Gammaproteobacteria bacterium]MBT4075169.1 ABC transporter ATP-binding protein [Gammaproteobacteria bacterium]MBT4194722.1 ABC transporter ATP-binding protein [Gammaproteobacteria bacterium]MBT4448368.1 ABC transporter ATP-binding protein [Gammaproteobacteria bacterium]